MTINCMSIPIMHMNLKQKERNPKQILPNKNKTI